MSPLTILHVSDPKVRANSRAAVLTASIASSGVATVVDLDLDRRRPHTIVPELLKARRRHDPDAYLVSFRGHELFPAVKATSRGRPILFDSLVSPSDSMVVEQKLGQAGKVAGQIVVRPLERCILRSCDFVITDTPEHTRFFIDTFDLSPENVDHVWVGAPLDASGHPITAPATTGSDPNRGNGSKESAFEVLWYGSFTPQHGVEVLVDAAVELQDDGVNFRIIGGAGKRLERFRTLVAEAGVRNIDHAEWVDFGQLIGDLIPNSDLCLGGPFGNTPQAQRAITQKAMQMMSQGRPTVIGRGATSRHFEDRREAIVVDQGSGRALAEGIRWAMRNRDELAELGRAGQARFERVFGLDETAEQMRSVVHRVLGDG